MPSATPTTAIEPKRRWYQYSLRTLILFMTVCGIGCGWFGTKLRKAQRQKEAVSAIFAEGGEIRYDYDNVRRDRPPSESSWLQDVLGVDFCANVVEARLFAGSGWENVRNLNELQDLSLQNDTEVNDDYVAHLCSLIHLQRLNLGDTSITDAGLEYLKQLENLNRLELWGNHVTAAAVQKLQQALHDLH